MPSPPQLNHLQVQVVARMPLVCGLALPVLIVPDSGSLVTGPCRSVADGVRNEPLQASLYAATQAATTSLKFTRGVDVSSSPCRETVGVRTAVPCIRLDSSPRKVPSRLSVGRAATGVPLHCRRKAIEAGYTFLAGPGASGFRRVGGGR